MDGFLGSSWWRPRLFYNSYHTLYSDHLIDCLGSEFTIRSVLGGSIRNVNKEFIVKFFWWADAIQNPESVVTGMIQIPHPGGRRPMATTIWVIHRWIGLLSMCSLRKSRFFPLCLIGLKFWRLGKENPYKNIKNSKKRKSRPQKKP